MFILGDDGRTPEAFERYVSYINDNADGFPPNALELVRSDWYFGFTDHRAPHDSRLESVQITEHPAEGEPGWGNRMVSISLRLRGAHDDGDIHIRYPQVISYFLDGSGASRGHRDWRYDELRLGADGLLVHEIEWCGAQAAGRWVITASDIELSWHPDA